MKQTICLNLAGLAVFGIMILTGLAAVDPSVLDQFKHPDRGRAALQKLRDTLWPEAQEANPIALKIVENVLRALDQDREDDELPFTMPKKLSAAAARAWQAPVRKKTEAGDMFFACVLGSMYLEGSGIEKDESQGLAWLQKAAEAQSALAHSWLGYAYAKGLGGPVDYSKAIEHYLQAGKLGLAAGWNNAGWHQSEYHLMGPEFPSPKECYEKAMALNYPRACYNLGLSYMKGESGVALDKVKGLSLIRQAAKENCHKAKHFLADGYVLHGGFRYTRQSGELSLGYALLQPPPGKKEKSRELLDALQHQQLDTAKLLIERERDSTFYIGDEESTTAMHAAVVYNQLGILHKALQKGGDLNARNDFGYTPLQLAILYDRKVITDYLIEQGARLDALAAALSDHPELLQEVLESDPDQVDSRDERGMTPLHLAARRRLLKNVEHLLDFGADPNARNIFDETPLHTVVYSKNLSINYASVSPPKPEETILAIIDLLLAYGADINAKDKVPQHEPLTGSGTPLMAALSARYPPAAELLVARGAEVNVCNIRGRPAIFQAAAHAPGIALIMIERGVDVHYRADDGWSLLHSAVYSEDERLIETLLSHGVDINAKDQRGETALDYAVRIGKLPAIVAVYQKHGIAVPDSVLSAPPAKNPLEWCIASLSFEGKHYSEKALIEQIERGMTNYQQLINVPNKIGNITLPLSAAVSYDRYEITKWLIKKGADVNARTPAGRTALFSAVEGNRLRMVKLLLENKADPNEKVKGVSPLQQARKSGHADIIKLLLAYGASE